MAKACGVTGWLQLQAYQLWRNLGVHRSGGISNQLRCCDAPGSPMLPELKLEPIGLLGCFRTYRAYRM